MNKGQFRVAKRTQKDYSLAFKLQVVEEGLLSQDAGNATILVWLRKHGRLDWSPKQDISKKASPNKKIRELEKKIGRLEAEKKVLNTAIDTADETLHTHIRKKYLRLLSAETNNQQASDEKSSTLDL